MTKKTEQQHIDEVRDRLVTRFPARPADEVTATVDTVYREFGTTSVRDFIPLLVERRAGEELRALSH